MTLRKALARARRIANRTGRPVTVLVRNPWITSRGRRMLLDAHGRIERGGPGDFQGVHIRDLSPLAATWRRLMSTDCEREIPKQKRARYRAKHEAMDAIERGNRNLHDFLESIYANELPHNLDSYEALRGRKFKTWGAAFADAVPAGGYWDRVWESPRFEAFREAIEASYDWPGGHIEPPDPILNARARQDAVARCDVEMADAIHDLLRDARRGRLGALEEAPF